MTMEQSDSVAIDEEAWELTNKDDYTKELIEILKFPLQKDDGLMKLFIVGSRGRGDRHDIWNHNGCVCLYPLFRSGLVHIW